MSEKCIACEGKGFVVVDHSEINAKMYAKMYAPCKLCNERVRFYNTSLGVPYETANTTGLGSALRAYRIQSRASIMEICRHIDIHPSQLMDYEKGRAQMDFATAMKIVDVIAAFDKRSQEQMDRLDGPTPQLYNN